MTSDAGAYARAEHALRTGQARSAEALLRSAGAGGAGDAQGLRLLGAALLFQGRLLEAVAALENAVRWAPRFAAAHTDLSRAYRACGRLQDACDQARLALAASPQFDLAWLAYGDALVDLGRCGEARQAFDQARLADPERQRIEEATASLVAGDRRAAETVFREILRADPGHVASLCGLAAVSLTVSRGADALRLLHHAQRQSAHLPLAWRGLCQTLVDLNRLPEAESAVRHLLRTEPENPNNWVLLGTVCTRLMRQPDALVAYEEAAKLLPLEVRLRLSIGHLNKTLGRRAECEAAYRQCLAMDPRFGEAYWSLADLKNYEFSGEEIASMRELLRGDGGEDLDQAMLHFALGRALEQQGRFAAAFDHYVSGNARRRRSAPFDIAHFEDKTERIVRTFDAAFFAARTGTGRRNASPVFIVGLPRSGSTLVEQILASHSQVEGTFELPNVLTLVREFDHADAAHDAYPEAMVAAAPPVFERLGARYLAETAPLRTGRARFIDKMPNNFSHVGLIHAILPDALVIDVRRHPMDACFSTFKQYFAEGQSFSYDLGDLGRYYRCYLKLMDHWDRVLPGRVVRVGYEDLVRDPENEIRRLLERCGLAFEESCLRFHETRRAVRTASAEQVRRPMNSSGVGYWRRFERQLEPLRDALGDTLQRFEERRG